MNIIPRLEKKIFLTKDKFFIFKKWLIEKGAKKIYHDRIVKSLYFDNQNLQSYYDSEEGVVPRKKVRLRQYNNSKKINLEKKYTLASYRAKFSSKNFLNKNNLSFHDSLYGLLKPKVIVTYNRSYYKFANYRITIDKNIKYYKYKSRFFKSEKAIVAEIKSNLNAEKNFSFIFPFTLSRFSKYSNAIKAIYNK